MKKLLSLLSSIAVIMLTAFPSQAQENEIYEIKFNDIQVLKSGKEINGYYLFYKAKKQKGKEILYHLQILDKEGQEVAENDIVGSKEFHLLEGVSNGNLMAFKFYDMKNDLEIIKIYNQEAEELRSIEVELDRNQQMMTKASIKSNSPHMPSLFAVEGKGFVNSRMLLKGLRFGYEVQFLPNDASGGWKITSDDKLKDSQSLRFIGNTSNTLYFIKAIGSKAEETKLVGLSIENGAEKFESEKIDVYTDERLVLNFFFKEASQEIFSLGLFDQKKDKGILLTKYDMQGKVLNEAKINWKDELGDIEKKGSIFFHDLQKDESGIYRLIGEHYKLSTSGLLTIGDFFVIDLNEDLSLRKAEKFPKESNSYQMGQGFMLVGTHTVALGFAGSIADHNEWFDFSHMVSTENSFEAYFANNSRSNQKGDNTLLKVSWEDEGYKMHSKVIGDGPDLLRMLPATDGRVLLFKFFDKEKDLQQEFMKF